jgi:hypothetical protein
VRRGPAGGKTGKQAGDRPFLAYLAHKAIHPNVVQRDDGRVVLAEGQPAGFVAAVIPREES